MPYKSFGFTDHQLMIRDTIIGLMEHELPPEKIERAQVDELVKKIMTYN